MRLNPFVHALYPRSNRFRQFCEISFFRMIEINSVKINFGFAAFSAFVSAPVAFATAGAMMRGSWINSSNRPGASIWDVC